MKWGNGMGYEYSILVLNLTEGPGKDIKSENIPPGMVPGSSQTLPILHVGLFSTNSQTLKRNHTLFYIIIYIHHKSNLISPFINYLKLSQYSLKVKVGR